MSGHATFDFGRGDELPGPRRAHSVFRKLGNCGDPELLTYICRRRISPGFLFEIDILLSNHPELERYAPVFVEQFNRMTPLNAYRHFLKGYTRPCRYVDGVIPSVDFVLPPNSFIPPIVNVYDEELADFFRGYEYRDDILRKIDIEVFGLCNILMNGGRVSRNQRMLVSYHLYGQPVDCYKWYEYSYQEQWLAHRYLPEHVVLCDIPKAPDYVEPDPHVLDGPGEDDKSAHRRYQDVRLHMARACDQGVDVIDVLLEEFTTTLAKKGLTRQQIEDSRVTALQALDQERADPTDKDIVDMVMDMARATEYQAPRYEKPMYFAADQETPVFPNFNFVTPGMSTRVRRHQSFNNPSSAPKTRSSTRTKPMNKGVPNKNKHIKKQEKRKNDLRRLKNSLKKIYRQEIVAKALAPIELQTIAESRRRLEREFVFTLANFVSAGGDNAKGLTGADLQRLYGKHYQNEGLQITSEEMEDRIDILALFPPSLC